MLKRRALIAASHSPSALAQHVARRIGALQDDISDISEGKPWSQIDDNAACR
jgi:hypothetical protein